MRRKTRAKEITCFAVALITLLFSTTPVVAQNDDRDGLVKDFVNEFDRLQAALVKIRIRGESLTYRTSEFVPLEDEEVRPIIVMQEQQYTVAVPYTEVIDGREVVKKKFVEVTRYSPVQQVARGKYRIVDVPIGEDVSFESLNGNKFTREEVKAMVGMNDRLVAVVPSEFQVPEAWSELLKEETLILRTDKPLLNQTFQTPASSK